MKTDIDLFFATAGSQDEALLNDFMRQLREDDPEEGAYDEPRSRPALQRLLADASLGQAWLIRVGDEPAGYVVLTFGYSLEYGGRDAFIDELFIARGFRGRGIGKQTLDFVAAEAKALGVIVLHLEVTRSNDVAKRLYTRAGFVHRDHHLMNRWLS